MRLKGVAPDFVVKGVEALLKKGSKKSLSEADVKKALIEMTTADLWPSQKLCLDPLAAVRVGIA